MIRMWGAAILVTLAALCASAEVQVINGRKYECKDGLCTLVEDGNASRSSTAADGNRQLPRSADATPSFRIAQGYMPADLFIAFLENREENPLGDSGIWLTLLLVLLGGLAMNLTPCVLPMIPINLIVIGRSARRGAAYGLGIALAYGALGLAAAFGGLAFGAIQGNPWFNLAVAVIFVLLALALLDVFFIDLSRFRPSLSSPSSATPGYSRPFFPFLMGALSAVLAGACVAPVLISVLLLTADLVAKGNRLAVLLPFVMGLGMALPWPFVGAGMKVLPRPGTWMRGVNRVFAVVVLGFAAWYGLLAWRGFRPVAPDRAQSIAVDGLAEVLATARRPVLVDCWATWCKNCAAMDAVLASPEVKKALEPYTVIRVQAEDIAALQRVPGCEGIKGLPAFLVAE